MLALRAGKQSPSKTVPVPMAPQQRSMIVPLLFERLDEDSRLTILDLGPAKSETVNFFSAYKCSLVFADLLSECTADELQVVDIEAESNALRTKFEAVLTNNTDLCFDLCFFWDVLNYLDENALRIFDTALSGLIHGGTRGHGFSVRTSDTILNHANYGIQANDEIAVVASPEVDHPCYGHPPSQLKEAFRSFDIQRGTLMRDGRIEVLFGASQLTAGST